MVIDNRKKGCPNEACIMNSKKKRQKSDIDYCPKCGTKLVYVCVKCFREIEDIDRRHRICSLCEAKDAEKRQKVLDNVKNGAGKAGKVIVGVGTPIVAGVAGKVVKDGQKAGIKAGVKAVENVAKAVLKK